MSLELLSKGLARDITRLQEEGRAKAPERVIVDHIPPQAPYGPRYRLAGHGDKAFIRMVREGEV